MKKIIIMMLAALLILSACTSLAFNNIPSRGHDETETETTEVVISTPIAIEKEEPNSPNVEENINAEDIEEDIDMTEKAQNENISEENTGTDIIELIEESSSKDTEAEVVLNMFESKIPEEVLLNKKYDKYQVFNNYLLILSASVNIREKPTSESRVIGGAQHFEKINLVAEVKGQYLKKYDCDSWYKVTWIQDDELQTGYIFSKLAEPREFQFEKMYDNVDKLKQEVENNLTAYISNYKNRNGFAPLINRSTVDNYGILRHQSAPAYYEANIESDFRYIADGTLVSVVAETESFYKISTLNFEGEYYIPKRYVKFTNSIEQLNKVIVVDRKNQNEGVFEYIDGKWNLISYIYATTGEKAKYKLPTDLGYYMAIEVREKFLYLDDETKEVAGYAPFAVRFSGGAYIHGVPVDFVKETITEIVEDEEVESTKLVDPGVIEYLFTIGTTPRSHKCVRNYTSHAEFLYYWTAIGNTAVIVIE